MLYDKEKDEPERAELVTRYPVLDDNGNTIGHVDLQPLFTEMTRRAELIDHVKQEVQQLRNQVLRIQNLVRALETKVLRR
jgi:hypothetical protein